MKVQFIMELDALDQSEARLKHREPGPNGHSAASLDMDRDTWTTIDGGRRYLVTIEPLEDVIPR
jgi:hypothetical protein